MLKNETQINKEGPGACSMEQTSIPFLSIQGSEITTG